MADFLSETQIGEIQNAYNSIDTDADGIIVTSELGSLLRLLGQNPTDAELQVNVHAVFEEKHSTHSLKNTELMEKL